MGLGISADVEFELRKEEFHLKWNDGYDLIIPYLGDEFLVNLMIKSKEFLNNPGAIDLQCKFSNIDAKTPFGNNALMFAVCNKHAEVVKILLENGADADTKSNAGESVLMCSSYSECIEIAKILINNGANVKMPNDSGMTALDAAYIVENKEMIKLIESNM